MGWSDDGPNEENHELAPMTKLEAWRAGHARFPAPPVCTAQWDEEAWIKFVDRDGEWLVPVRP